MGALEAIVFDFDGVIADSELLHLRTYQEVLAPLGVSLTDEDYYGRYLGYDDAGVLKRLAQDQGRAWSDAQIAELIVLKSRRYEERAAQGGMLFPGAADFIRRAAERIPLAIASGALTHEIEDILHRAGLVHMFVAIVGADQTGRSKPSPDPYLEAVHRLHQAGHRVADRRTVAIEDSVWGLVSAGSARLRCVAVTNTYPAAELAPHAELVVSGLDALTLDALDSLVGKGQEPRAQVSTRG